VGLVLASHQICVSPPTTPDRLWAPKKRAIASELSVQLGRKSVLAALEDLPPSVSSDDLFRLLRSGGWSSTVSALVSCCVDLWLNNFPHAVSGCRRTDERCWPGIRARRINYISQCGTPSLLEHRPLGFALYATWWRSQAIHMYISPNLTTLGKGLRAKNMPRSCGPYAAFSSTSSHTHNQGQWGLQNQSSISPLKSEPKVQF